MTPGAFVALPADLSAARRARSLVRERLCPAHTGHLLDPALLAVTELAVNAVEHGGPPVHAFVECRVGVLRLEVADGSGAPPRRGAPGVHACSGRGVGLVETVSCGWGVRAAERGRAGKTVWCDLDAA